jgi:hypothetical protein
LYLIIKVTEPTNTLMTYAVRLIWVVEDVEAGKSAVETLYTNLVFDKSSQSLQILAVWASSPLVLFSMVSSCLIGKSYSSMKTLKRVSW